MQHKSTAIFQKVEAQANKAESDANESKETLDIIKKEPGKAGPVSEDSKGKVEKSFGGFGSASERNLRGAI